VQLIVCAHVTCMVYMSRARLGTIKLATIDSHGESDCKFGVTAGMCMCIQQNSPWLQSVFLVRLQPHSQTEREACVGVWCYILPRKARYGALPQVIPVDTSPLFQQGSLVYHPRWSASFQHIHQEIGQVYRPKVVGGQRQLQGTKCSCMTRPQLQIT